MKKLFLIILFNAIPNIGFSYTNTGLPHIDIATLQFSTQNPSIHSNTIVQYFQQKRYDLFLKELGEYKHTNSHSPYSNELAILEGVSLAKIESYSQAEDIFLSLTNSDNLQIRHQALLCLYQIFNTQLKNGKQFLQKIQDSPLNSPYKEIAHIKLIYLFLRSQEFKSATILSESFEKLYPSSPYLDELQYLMALNNLHNGNVHKARVYVKNILSKRTNIKLELLLGELALQENKIDQALAHFLPISESYNPYQDQGLFKSALLYKKKKEFKNAHKLLENLLAYHPSSQYIEQAFKEFANINIALQNYDDALIYYLQESKQTGQRKAYALLKIAEIHFLEKNTPAVQRAVNRLQKEFPYSSFANESLYWLGRSHLLEANYDDSINVFKEYIIREPHGSKKDEIQIFLGHAYANKNDMPSARKYFHNIINDSSSEMLKRQALLGLGRSYSATEEKRALEYFDRVWKVWENSAESEKALYYSAAIRYNLRMNKESGKLFQQFINKYPNSPYYTDANLALAKLEFKSENFTDIIDIENIALTASNKEQVSELKELQARSFFRITQYEDALPLFQESFSLTTNKTRKTDLFLAEASTLRALGRHKEAVQNYEKYLKSIEQSQLTNELSELLWAEIAFSYLETRDVPKATETLDLIKTHYPKSKNIPEIHFKIADECFSKKRYKQAAENYALVRSYTQNNSLKADALLREAWSRNYSNDPESENIFNLFLDTYPRHFGVSDIKLKLANTQEEKNNPDHIKLRHSIIRDFPDSIEAEESRTYFAKQLTPSSDIEEFKTALRETKDKRLQSLYLFKLGLKYKDEADYDKALEVFRRIHTLEDPNLGAKALFEVGEILNQQEKYQESLQVYINIISQYDEEFYPKSLDKIIQTYILLDDFDNARKFKERLIERFPDSEERKKWK